MAKNIVICADGTGNTAIKGRGTNVFKLYEAVDGNGHRSNPTLVQQVAIYHDGVGTESLRWLRIFTGATGFGLSRNVKQLYGELARVYEPGDRIFVFGFSRGAFTVRTLAGLINTCGILDVDRYGSNALFNKGIDDTYKQYRRKYQTWLSRKLFGEHDKKPDPAELQKHRYVEIPGFDERDAARRPFHRRLGHGGRRRPAAAPGGFRQHVHLAVQVPRHEAEQEGRVRVPRAGHRRSEAQLRAAAVGRGAGGSEARRDASSRSGLPARIRTSAAGTRGRACRSPRSTG